MTRAQALKLARAKLGKKATVEENKAALDPQTRAIVRAEYAKLKAEEPQPPPPTPEVLEYRRKRAVWLKQMENLRGNVLSSRRCRIVEDSSWIRHIVGEGDTWEEAARNAKLIPEEKNK